MARRARSSKAKGPKKRDRKGPKPEKENVRESVISETEGPKVSSSGKEVRKRPKISTGSSGEGGLKEWYNRNRNTIFILLGIFVFAFLIREFFYYQISFNVWPPNIVGNDPSYHKRVIDFVQHEHYHLKIDPLLNYPISGGNPRPPIFDWSIAVFGIILSPFFGFNVENSTWFVFEFAPTIWGALTIFPMYLLGKETFGRKTGIMAAFFLAITASHIERSTLGFTDHDSFVVFFVVLSMFFLAKAFSVQKDRNYISDWRKPDSVLLGFRAFSRANKKALLYAFMAGLSIATIALTWQGYGYVLAILLIYYLIQLLIHRFRNEDPLGTFIVIFIAMGTVVFLSLPYYFVFSIATWSQGFYILLAMTALGVFIVPTRDIPWLLVIPTLGLFLLVSYFLLQWGFPQTADMLFTGGGYFVKSKLYSTIAEAQAPDISRVVFTYGPATFFLGLIGVVMAAIKIPKMMRKDYIVIVVWTAVAIYMALSAIRFNFNATPAFALLAGWVVVKIVEFFKAEGLSIVFSILAVVIFILGFLVLSENWNSYFSRNFLALTILPISLISVIYFGYMKYRKKREYFKFRKILTALGIGFIVIFPNLFFAMDAAIPIESKKEFDPNMKFLGSFGSSLHSEYWMDSYNWLAQQDILFDNKTVPPQERPAFMSWWDYGFDELLLGKHPTAADNFQNGYQFTGSIIACQNESESIALMTSRLLEGNWVKNKQSFSDDIWDILVKYLGDDRNSTLSAYELKNIYKHPGKYVDIVQNNPDRYGKFKDITWPNARYAAARGVMMHLGEEGLVDLYHDVRVATGKSLRYFAVDYRLFPFSARNTGIFYAPITLADRDVQDYLEYKVYAQENTRGSNDDPKWTDYPDNPISMEKARQESERLGYKFKIKQTEMFYTDAFYNSLFYRTYIGYEPQDVGQPNDGKSVPGFPGNLQNLPPMQGWNMTHWKLVYRTMYYSEKDEANSSFPDDYTPMESKKALELYQKNSGDVKSGLGQGVFYIKYYDGAVIHGRVKTGRGVGVPGARVTVLDDYGIPHGNVITGPDGEYSIIVPPGRINLVVTEGPLDNQYDKLYQFQMDQSTGQPKTLLNSTVLQISDELAMRMVDDGTMKRDLIIPGKTLSGKIYWDLNGDSSYTKDTDKLVAGGSITFELKGSAGTEYGPYELGEDGTYSFEDLVQGKYDIIYTFGSSSETLITDYQVDLRGESTRDIRIDNTIVSGHVALSNGVPAQDQTVILEDEEGGQETLTTDPGGNFTVDRLFPGIYSLKVENSYYTHDPVKFEVGQGDNVSFNITLYPRGDLYLKAFYPEGYSFSGALADLKKEVVPGGIMTLTDISNIERSWTVFLDGNGEAHLELPTGIYDVGIYSIDRDSYWAYLGSVEISWREETRKVATLERGIRINGTLTKLENDLMNGTEIKFARDSDGAVAHIITNEKGTYNCYLPKDSYSVMVHNTTHPGGVIYIQLQKINGNIQDDHIEVNIKAVKTVKVTGRLFWDKDANRNFTSADEARQREGDPSPPAAEVGLEGVKVRFEYENGTIEALAGTDGEYNAFLPPRDYMMKVDKDGFYPFSRELAVEDTAEALNFGLNGIDAPMDTRERQVQMNITIPYYGKDGIRHDPASNLEFQFSPVEAYMNGEIRRGTTDSDGVLTISLPPGEYTLGLLDETSEGDVTHTLRINQDVFVEPSSSIFYTDPEVTHDVAFEGTMYFVENSIPRYPADMSVNFNAIKGTRVTMVSGMTDINGKFKVVLPAGDFILEAHQERPGIHYMYWDVVSLDFGTAPGEFEMTQGFPVHGNVRPGFKNIGDSEIFFIRDDLWASAEINSNGEFSTVLFTGTYRADYSFFTQDPSLGDGIQVEYFHNSTVEVEGAIFDLEIDLDKNVEVRGAVYYDQNGDRTIQPEERRGGINVTFTPAGGGDPVWVVSNPGGDFSVMVPFTRLEISVDADGFRPHPRDDVKMLDLPAEGISLWDIPLVPDDVTVSGYMFRDIDENGKQDTGEPAAADVELTFTPREGNPIKVVTGAEGSFSMKLPPEIYNVLGMKYMAGKPDIGYLSELSINLGDNLTGREWPAVRARRVTGTLFYRDTDGKLLLDPPEQNDISFTRDGGGKISTGYSGGVYSVDLPYGTYYVSSRFSTEEYHMEMPYRISKQIILNDSTTADDVAMEFDKVKEYSFNINLVNNFQHEIEMSPMETTRLQYFIENIGNEPYSVSMEATQKPDGWTVEFPLGKDIPLEIGGRVTRWVNITAPMDPDFSNSLIFQAQSNHNTKNNFQVEVKTPSSFRFELGFDIPDTLGVDYDEERVFNISVRNLGNGEDVVNLHMSPEPDEVKDWEVQWEGSSDFPSSGENVSLLPKGARRYAITVRTPHVGNDTFYNEKLTLTFTGKNRIGDVVKKQVTLEVQKPNLVLPPGFLKLTNRRLDDPVLNRTIEANITVKSLHRDVHSVNVSLQIDGKVVAEGVIPYIPQDGIGHTRVRFNVTDLNITENSFHTFEVFVDPYNDVKETDDFDNVGIWNNVVLGKTPGESMQLNWRIIIFFLLVIVVALAIIAYRQKTQPI